MENKIAIVGIIISDSSAVATVNGVLHENMDYIVGRLGLPYKQRGVNVISIVIDAPQQVINALSGKLGMISGVTSKVLITK